MASPGAPTGLAAPRGVGGTQPRGLGPRGAPEGAAVWRLGPLDRLRATQGCGIGSSCRSHATLGIKRFPVFEARCTGSSNSQTV